MFDDAVGAFGRLDCDFNNAGIGGAFGPISETRVEDWDFTLGVLLRGVFLGMKHGARIVQAQGQGGAIVSTTSTADRPGRRRTSGASTRAPARQVCRAPATSIRKRAGARHGPAPILTGNANE